MRYEIVLSLNGLEERLQVISGTFKNWVVWKVQFKTGEEVILFKHMDIWMQRNEDSLDHRTIAAIGKQIDHLNLKVSLA
ncbi:MAG TPA: hypothetical protein VIM16_01830 [Mucilaginibacter sp.]|jgi:hypothetical protein